jgi:hypothetical protein
MKDKVVLSKDVPTGFFVYQLEHNKWQVRTRNGSIVGNAASLEQVDGTMKRKMAGYPYILYLHTVDVIGTINTHPAL